VIDVTDKTYTIELTGDGGKLDAFIEAIERFSNYRDGSHWGLPGLRAANAYCALPRMLCAIENASRSRACLRFLIIRL
jgi:hypothetical protein